MPHKLFFHIYKIYNDETWNWTKKTQWSYIINRNMAYKNVIMRITLWIHLNLYFEMTFNLILIIYLSFILK